MSEKALTVTCAHCQLILHLREGWQTYTCWRCGHVVLEDWPRGRRMEDFQIHD